MWLLRFFRRCRGSVSILLAIALLPSLLMAGLLVDLANRNMSKAIVEEAGELAAASILSRYDTVLEDVYGIFAISQDYADLQENVQKYMEDTISAAGFLSAAGDTQFQSRLMQALQSRVRDFLGASELNASAGLIQAGISDLSAQGTPGSSLTEAAILENQIVEFMKYRGPAEVGMGVFSMINTLKGIKEQSAVTLQKTKLDEKAADAASIAAKLYNALKELDEMIRKVEDAEPKSKKNNFGEWTSAWDEVRNLVGWYGENYDYYQINDSEKSANWQVVNKLYGKAGNVKKTAYWIVLHKSGEYKFGTDSNPRGEDDVTYTVKKHTDVDSVIESAEVLAGYYSFIETYVKEYRKNGDNKAKDIIDRFYKSATKNNGHYSEQNVKRLEDMSSVFNDHMKLLLGLKEGFRKTEKEIKDLNNRKFDEDGLSEEESKKLIALEAAYKPYKEYWEEITRDGPDSLSGVCIMEDWRIIGELLKGYYDRYTSACDNAYSHIRKAWDKFKDYRGAVNDILEKKYPASSEKTYFAYILELIDILIEQVEQTDELKKQYQDSLDDYQKKAGSDSFHTNMSAQIAKDENIVTAESLLELRGQVVCIQEYLRGLQELFNDSKFYGIAMQDIGQYSTDQVRFGRKAVEHLKKMANTFPDTYSVDRDKDALLKATANACITVIRSPLKMRDGFYLKQVMMPLEKPKQENEISIYFGDDDLSVGVPACCIALAAQFGSNNVNTDGLTDMDGNLTKTTANQSNSAADTPQNALAEGIKSPYDYLSSVFSESSPNSEAGDGSGFAEVDENDKTGGLKQLNSMLELVNGLLGVLDDLTKLEFESIRDKILVTEYIRENFSSYYNTTTGFRDAYSASNSPTIIKQGTLCYPTTMTGVMIAPQNNTIFGCEQEYILYGYTGSHTEKGFWFWKSERDTGPWENIKTVQGNIYAIRLVCNAIYALTDSSLDKETIPPAMVIQAATGGFFPMQVAQVIIKICLALLETNLDMQRIMKGSKVALIKNSQTWVCSVGGLIRTIKDKAIEAAAEKVEEVAINTIADISCTLQSMIEEGIDTGTGKLEDGVDNIVGDVEATVMGLVDEAVSSIANAVTAEAQKMLTNAFTEASDRTGPVDETVLKTEFSARIQSVLDTAINSLNVGEDIKNVLRDVFNSLGADGLVDRIWDMKEYTVLVKTADGVKPSKVKIKLGEKELSFGELMVKLYTAANNPADTGWKILEGSIGMAANAVTTAVQDFVEEQMNGVSGKVKGLLNGLSDQLKEKSRELFSAAEDEAAKMVDSYVDDVSKTVSAKMEELFPTNGLKVEGKSLGEKAGVGDSGNTAKTFLAGYDDYLLLFLFLGICSDQHDAIVSRIGEVIGLNLRGAAVDGANQQGGMQAYRKALELEGDTVYKDGGFQPGKAYTYVSIFCKVKLRPVLLSQKVIAGDKLEEVESSNLWTYSYSTVAGY